MRRLYETPTGSMVRSWQLAGTLRGNCMKPLWNCQLHESTPAELTNNVNYWLVNAYESTAGGAIRSPSESLLLPT